METTTSITPKPNNRYSPKQSIRRRLWYVSDRRIRSAQAAKEARQIAECISSSLDNDGGLDETQLFLAMHTCAYRACGRPNKEKIPEDERQEWRGRWRCIREYITSQNLGLAYSSMGRFQFKTVDSDDALSEALFALTRAVDRFNPFKGYRFSTYACNAIMHSLVRRLKQTRRYRQMFPIQHDVFMERPERLPDTRTELLIERLHHALDNNLGGLTDLESLILTKRFPVNQESHTTFTVIGRSVGLSKERVRQIQNIALAKLHRLLDRDPVLQEHGKDERATPIEEVCIDVARDTYGGIRNGHAKRRRNT